MGCTPSSIRAAIHAELENIGHIIDCEEKRLRLAPYLALIQSAVHNWVTIYYTFAALIIDRGQSLQGRFVPRPDLLTPHRRTLAQQFYGKLIADFDGQQPDGMFLYLEQCLLQDCVTCVFSPELDVPLLRMLDFWADGKVVMNEFGGLYREFDMGLVNASEEEVERLWEDVGRWVWGKPGMWGRDDAGLGWPRVPEERDIGHYYLGEPERALQAKVILWE